MNDKKMKKFLVSAVAFAAIAVIGVSCNRQPVDLTFKFDRAIVKLPNGEIVEGELQSWLDYEDSDQIQVKIGGKTYLVHSMNCTLIAE